MPHRTTFNGGGGQQYVLLNLGFMIKTPAGFEAVAMCLIIHRMSLISKLQAVLLTLKFILGDLKHFIPCF